MASIAPITFDIKVDTRLAVGKLRLLQLRLAILSAILSTAKRSGEIATYMAFVGGWLLITAGITHVTSSTAWLFSLGLLAICLGGIKPLAMMAWNGLYALSRDDA